jgi:hypothetical protein
MLKLKTHSGFHDLFRFWYVLKSTNTVVYFDWKTVIYIYVCAKCRTQFMLPMEKSSRIHRRMCEWDYTIDKIARLSTKRKKDVMLEL